MTGEEDGASIKPSKDRNPPWPHPLLSAEAGTQVFYRQVLRLAEKAWVPACAGKSGTERVGPAAVQRKRAAPEGGPSKTLINENAYGALVAAFIGAVAAASFAALLAAIAEFDAALAEAIAALASEAAAFASAVALPVSAFLQAATETAATAAPTIRIVRSVPEVMFLVPSG
jgi:hypothetical protein